MCGIIIPGMEFSTANLKLRQNHQKKEILERREQAGMTLPVIGHANLTLKGSVNFVNKNRHFLLEYRPDTKALPQLGLLSYHRFKNFHIRIIFAIFYSKPISCVSGK